MRHSFFAALLFLQSFVFSQEDSTPRYKVGLCIVATGRYDVYAQALIESARPYFCKNHDVTYFVFTDGKIATAKDVVRVEQARLGWPYDTLQRFHMYDAHQELFDEMDYLFATDADMLFVGAVGDEILGDLVVTQHPGYVSRRGTYETRKTSTAYVSNRENGTYFAGGLYGGKRTEFLTFIAHAKKQIDKDLERGIIAVWHDESHLNRYFLNNKPSIILSPSYCYPENLNLPYPKKLLALDKDHEAMRK